MKGPKQDSVAGLVLYVVLGIAGLTGVILALLMLGAWLSRMGV